MRVSIVTISYNQGEFLERAIKSVIEQDYNDIEYIIVDPGSTDGSREIIERYRSQIDKIIFELDDGPADGLNKGFRCATGEIFGYLNSDDVYLPRTFKEVANFFRTNPTTDVVYGHGYFVDRNGTVLRRFYSDTFSVRRYVYGGSVIMQQSTFFRREAFESVGGFNSNNRTWWDGELILDFGLQRKNIKQVDDFWSLFRIHDSSITGSGRLYDEYLRDIDRLYVKTYGRTKGWLDAILIQVTRLERWVRNPNALFSRVKTLFPQRHTTY